MIKTVIGSFDSADDADRATRDLRNVGFADTDINLVVSNVRQGDADTELPAMGDGTGPVAKGAVAGGVLGGAAGLAVSLAGLAIPGIGPLLTAGPIIATLAGAGAGAVAGGVIGSLTELGVERKEAELYAEAVRRGGTLVTLRTDESRADEASAILRKAGAIDISRRAEDWRATGWMRGERTWTRDADMSEAVASSAAGLSDGAWGVDEDIRSRAGPATHIPR
ncbi:MAG TPA: hypothetical protein VGL25_14655 [Casimicrobiaceae bacterium]